MKNKIFDTFSQAVSDIRNGDSIAWHCLGGPSGIPQNLILALRDLGAKDLTLYSCSTFGSTGGLRIKPGFRPYVVPGILVENHQVRKVFISWGRGESGETSVLERAASSGEVEVILLPLGVYAYKLLAGASGMGGFFSPVGIGTFYEKGKEKRLIDGKQYIFEPAIRAKYGFIHAHKADPLGNLVYHGTARGFNPLIAKASDITIAEVDEIVEIGELGPEAIVTPGIFIDRIIKIPPGGRK